MGFCPNSTPEMGEYSIEVRSESFVLYGEDCYNGPRRHAIFLYPSSPNNRAQGTIEILLEDIPKIRAALDLIENTIHTQKGKS